MGEQGPCGESLGREEIGRQGVSRTSRKTDCRLLYFSEIITVVKIIELNFDVYARLGLHYN